MKNFSKLMAAALVSLSLISAGAYAASTPDKKERTGEYIDDSVITTKVKAAILKDSSLKVGEINVETFKGVVQLSGFVSTRASAKKAGEVARGIRGVKSVKNDLRIK